MCLFNSQNNINLKFLIFNLLLVFKIFIMKMLCFIFKMYNSMLKYEIKRFQTNLHRNIAFKINCFTSIKIIS